MRDVTADSTWEEINDYAQANHRAALDLYGLIFPPWRWPRWFRESREVRRRVAVTRAAQAAKRARRG
jgi:hypothetical protein